MDITLPLPAFLSLSPSEMLVVAVVALLLFGGDLPRVAREWGKHFVEFRRHLSGIREELNEAIYAEPDPPRRLQHHPQYHAPPSVPSAPALVTDAASDTSDTAAIDSAPADAVETPASPTAD